MKRRLNLRLLLWTVGCLGALAFGVNVLHGYQVRRNAHYLLERSDQALANKDRDLGLAYLRQYLALAPNDLDALDKLTVVLEESARDPGDQIHLALRLEELLRRDPQRHAARRRLIQTLISLYRWNDAIVHLQIALTSGEQEAEAQHLLGWCHAVGNDSTAAVKALTRAIEIEPSRLASHRLLADVLLQRLGQEDEAVAVMNKMVQANDADHRAYLARSRFARQRGKLKEADADLAKAITLAPDDAEVLLAASNWAEGRTDLDEARRHLQRGVELHPDQGVFVKALADIELRSGRRDEARRILHEGLQRLPQAYDLQVLRAELLIDAGDHAEAERSITALVRAGLPPTLPNYLRARLAVAEGKWAQAVGLLEKVRVDMGTQTPWSSRVYALLGACYEQLGDPDRRVTHLQRAVQIEPGWTLAKYHLGQALLAAGRVEEAAVELETASRAKDVLPQVWTALARAQLTLTSRRPAARRDWSAVEIALVKAAAGDSPEAVALVRAEMFMARSQFAEARLLLDQHRLAAKHNVALWIASADLEIRQARFDAGLQILDDAVRALGDLVDLRLARVHLHVRRGQTNDRDALHALARNIDHDSLEDKTRILRALAHGWQLLGEAGVAEQIARQIAHLRPSDVVSRFFLLDLALQRGDTADAKELLADLRKAEGEQGIRWRWATAALQIQEARGAADQLADARTQLAELARRHIDSPRIALLEARIDEIEGKWDNALRHWLKAIELGERDYRFTHRLTQILLERRLFAHVERVLTQWEQDAPLPPELTRAALTAATANRNVPRARQLIQQLFPATPRDYRDLVWLAQRHADLGEMPKAETLLRQAVLRAEHVPETWLALIEHLARTGQHPAAEAVLRQMQEKLPAKHRPFALAQGYDAAGDGPRAEAAFAKALAERPNDFVVLAAAADFYWRGGNADQAATHYTRLLDPQVAAPADETTLARRRLALHYIHTGQGKEASALLDANFRASGEHAADQRLRWFLDGQDPARRRQAIQLLRESFVKHASDSEEELLLVRLYEAADDVSQAQEHLANLLMSQEKRELIAWKVRLAVRAESFDEASLWLAKLERWEPASPRTRELKRLVAKN